MNFISDMEKKLELFIAVYGRKPINGTEFSEWCSHVESNSTIRERNIIVID